MPDKPTAHEVLLRATDSTFDFWGWMTDYDPTGRRDAYEATILNALKLKAVVEHPDCVEVAHDRYYLRETDASGEQVHVDRITALTLRSRAEEYVTIDEAYDALYGGDE